MSQKEDEIDFSPTPAKQITDFFSGSKAEAEAQVDEELGQLMEKELSEALLKQFMDAKAKEKEAKEVVEILRAEIIALAGKDRGKIVRGSMILDIQEHPGKVTADYERYIKDSVGDKAWKELQNDVKLVKDKKADCSWVKVGKPYFEISVDQVRTGV